MVLCVCVWQAEHCERMRMLAGAPQSRSAGAQSHALLETSLASYLSFRSVAPSLSSRASVPCASLPVFLFPSLSSGYLALASTPTPPLLLSSCFCLHLALVFLCAISPCIAPPLPLALADVGRAPPPSRARKACEQGESVHVRVLADQVRTLLSLPCSAMYPTPLLPHVQYRSMLGPTPLLPGCSRVATVLRHVRD